MSARIQIQSGNDIMMSRDTLTLMVLRARLQTAAVQVPVKLVDGREVRLVGLPEEELNYLLFMLKDL